jgi:SAM-dependent methyltransferase
MFWDERYAAASYFYGTLPNDFLKEQARFIPAGGTVLCLGEGEGRNAVFLAEQGHDVVALDQSAVGLTKARQLAASKSVPLRTIVADLDGYRFDAARWDGIVSIWCHLPQSVRSAIHRQVIVGLKPGGVLVLEAYTPQQLRHATGGPKDVDLLPTLGELRQDLRGLEFLDATERERVVLEGTGHRGMSAVVQIVARRPAQAVMKHHPQGLH